MPSYNNQKCVDIATVSLGETPPPQLGTIVNSCYKLLRLVISSFYRQGNQGCGSRRICPDGKGQNQELELISQTGNAQTV